MNRCPPSSLAPRRKDPERDRGRQALHDRRDGFVLSLALTRDQPRREGDFARRVDDAMMGDLLKRLPSLPSRVFVCGANPFVSAAADAAIAAGIAPALIRTERYGQ